MTALAGPLYVILGVLAIAGFAKLARPSVTATALRELSVPRPVAAARLLGAAEITCAALALVNGNALAWAAVAAVYASFTVFVLWALGANTAIGSCGCFGQEDTPPTPGHAAFNAAAAAIAGLAVADPVRLGDFDGSTTQVVLFVGLVAVGVALSILALTVLPRTLALARGEMTPTKSFSIGGSLTKSDRPPNGTTA